MEAGTDYFSEPEKMPRPYVTFETRPVEKRVVRADETVDTVYEDVVYAIIRSPGSRDSVEKVASEWIETLKVQAEAGRVPSHWPRAYNEALQGFIKGEEIPIQGTPIKTWPALTPAQRKAVLNTDIRTVEELAMANSDIHDRIGMGAVRLVDLAKTWVADQKGPGALAKKLEVVTVENAEMRLQIETLTAAVTALQAQVPGATKASLEAVK